MKARVHLLFICCTLVLFPLLRLEPLCHILEGGCPEAKGGGRPWPQGFTQSPISQTCCDHKANDGRHPHFVNKPVVYCLSRDRGL